MVGWASVPGIGGRVVIIPFRADPTDDRGVVATRMTEQIGRVLGDRYRLVAPLGSGASARVYLADDVTLRRRVAVKVLHPALADDDAFLRQFRAEARAAAALNHPNVMAVYDWGEDDGPYLVLEYLGGGSLRGMLDRGQRLSVSQTVLVAIDAARALDAAHRRGFVHRDIKPANLLFGDDGRLRVADFGLARALSEAAWTEPVEGLVGTARYAAPEQGGAGPVDGRADVYSLGLVLLEAVTGVVPLTAESPVGTLHLRAESDVPVSDQLGALGPLLQRTGRVDPAERPTAAEFGAELLGVARALPRPAPLPLVGPADGLVLPSGASAADPTILPGRLSIPADVDDHTSVVSVSEVAAGTAISFEAGRAGRGGVGLPPGGAGPGRRRRWGAFAAVVALVAAVVGGGLAWAQLRPATASVPTVVEMPLEQARAQLDAAQQATDGEVSWRVVEQADYSETVSTGAVIAQSPAPGSSLRDGGTVTLRYSKGQPPVPVPDMSNSTVEEATALLAQAGLTVGEQRPQADETAVAGTVLTWFGPDGAERPAQVAKTSAMTLLVSSGPAPRTIPGGLAGLSYDEAASTLAGVQLSAVRGEEFSSTVDKDKVIRTDPAEGTALERGAVVTVVVSKGRDLVKVPDVNGQTQDAAVALLQQTGLKVESVTGPAGAKTAYVTDPAAGTQLDRGSPVRLYLR